MNLGAFITESSLSNEDKDLWFSILAKIDDSQTKVFEDFIVGKEENLWELTENLKTKTKAFKNLDEKAMEKIIEQEISSSL